MFSIVHFSSALSYTCSLMYVVHNEVLFNSKKMEMEEKRAEKCKWNKNR